MLMAIYRLKDELEDSPWPGENFTGEWIVEWPNGVTKFRAQYVQGKPDGDYLCFWPNGRLAQKGRMCQGESVGRWTDYHQDGFVTATRDFIDGLIEGVERTYWRDGTVMEERTMRHTFLHGIARKYRRDGMLSFEGEFRDGEPWSGICEVSTFEQQLDGSYSILAEYALGKKVRDLRRDDYE